MLKRVAVLMVVCGILIVGGIKMPNVYAQDNGYTLSNNRLKLSFEPQSGLCSVTDKKTSKTWTQYYGLPPQDRLAFAFDFGSDIWDAEKAVKTDSDSNIEWAVPAQANSENKLQMKFPAPAIIPATYRLKIAYRFEKAKDVQLIGNFHFEQDGYNFLKTKEFAIDQATEATTSGWKQYELDIPLSEFPPYCNSFLVYFIVRGGADASGDIVLGEGGLYGGDPHTAAPKITNVQKNGQSIRFGVNNTEREQANLAPLTVSISLNPKQEDEVVTTLSAPKEDLFYQNLNYPPSFASSDKDLYWMLPKDAGLYLPAYDLKNSTNQAYRGGEFYAHMGFNMAFFGAVSNNGGDGYYALIDDPALTRVQYMVCGAADNKPAYMPQLLQIGTKNTFKKDRTVRFRFIENGGYVGIAKAYRQVAEKKGFAVTLKEKAKKNPTILKTAGASRIDLAIDVADLLKFFQKIKDADISNVMIKLSGLRNNSKYIDLNDLETLGVMKEIREKYGDFNLYEYEAYRDLFEKDGEFKTDPKYIALASPYKLRNVNGMPINGWKDITGLSAQIICPAFGRTYLDYRLQKYPMSTFPFQSRMYDVLATTSLSEGECYDENHPSDRLKCMDYRLDFVKYSSEKYGLDNHTEGAAEYLIPYVNSGEGPLDIMANNGMGINSMNVPPSDRIPLWELVYHDCFGIYHHWEHGLFASNPNINQDDLFSLLYGERGMFLPYYQDNPFMEGGVLDQMIARIKRIDTVTNQVKLDKMVSHSFLSSDKMVQKTVFESGVEVIVNFSDKTYRYKKGKVLEETKNVPSTTITDKKTSPVIYSQKQAENILIPPAKEIVVMTNEHSGGGYWKWIVMGAVGVAAILCAEVAIALRIKKKKEQQSQKEE